MIPAEITIKKEKNIPRPPRSGVGFLWILLSDGKDTILNFLAILPNK
jgi:hypothetical protein